MLTRLIFFLFPIILCNYTFCEEAKSSVTGTSGVQMLAASESISPRERLVETLHKIVINGVEISYKATAGIATLKDDNNKAIASLFYVAYTKEGENNPSTRPMTFCFNGGPGSAAVWLHMGLLGPRRVANNGAGAVYQPYHAIDNPFSMLDKTDLIFIDPITTGYSRPSPGQGVKQFQGVKEDIKSVANFIHLYTTRNARWESPKFLVGESYGTVRAVGLASYLLDTYYMPMNGIILVSSVLDFALQDNDNDLYYALLLPSYAAVAGFHKKLSPELSDDMSKTLQEVEDFALGEYASALIQGNNLSKEKRNQVIHKLSRYTGLSESYLDKADLRVEQKYFSKELLSDTKQQVGRFDGKITGYDISAIESSAEYDPSMQAVDGGFTAIFNQYLRAELLWDSDEQYIILNNASCVWNYGEVRPYAFTVVPKLKELLTQTHHLNIFVASGYEDLATPYFASYYTFHHLNMDPQLLTRIHMRNYHGGHMMYLYENVLERLKKDLDIFMDDIMKDIYSKEA